MSVTRSILRAMIVLGIVAVLWPVPSGSRSRMTCVICRLSRIQHRQLGVPWSSYQETSSSRWYSEHVEPSHHHLWVRGSCKTMTNVLGFGVGVACGRAPRIWRIDPDTQKRFYQRFDDPRAALAILRPLATTIPADAPDRDQREAESENVADAIVGWSLAGFEGRWDNWWSEHRRSHPGQG